MVQQIAAAQAVPAQTGQAASAQPAKDGDAFQTLMQTAVNASAKDDGAAENPETGGKSEKSDDRGGEETDKNPLPAQASLQAAFLPYGTAPLETAQLLSPNGTADTALPAADDAASEALGVIAEEPSDSSAVDPALRQEASAAPELPAAQKVSSAVPEDGSASAATDIPAAAQEEQRSAAVPAAEAGRTAPEKTQDRAKPGTADAVEAKEVPKGGTVPADKSEATAAERVSSKKAETSDENPLPGGKREIEAAANSERPQKKTEAPEPKEKTFSDLYANGNVVIKVSDAKPAKKPSAAGQVAQAVAQQVKQGRQEFQVELYPQSLGKVSVKLSAEDGVLTVLISASNPKTQSLLLSGSDDIRSMLQNSTGQNVNVVKPEQTGGWFARQDGGGHGGSGYREQEQDEENRKDSEALSKIRSVGMNTGSFLSILRLAQ